jgi:hypothetical protein
MMLFAKTSVSDRCVRSTAGMIMGKTKYWEKNLSQDHFVHHNSQTGLGMNFSLQSNNFFSNSTTALSGPVPPHY